MSSDLSELDFSNFKRKVKFSYGIDLEAYKRPQMERRIRANMDKCKVQTFTQYYTMMQKDSSIKDEFLDRVTINVSELFRNTDHFQILQDKVIPELIQNKGSFKVWSAGCSYGAEPYTLAIILSEMLPANKFSIYASDLDPRMLAKADKGEFTQSDVRGVTAARLVKHFDKVNGNYKAKPNLRKMIEFQKHDLLNDTYRKGFDLILCRNVVIYFTDEAKTQLYKKFFTSMNPRGYLFVGGTERISNYQDIGLESRYPFFYRKPELN